MPLVPLTPADLNTTLRHLYTIHQRYLEILSSLSDPNLPPDLPKLLAAYRHETAETKTHLRHIVSANARGQELIDEVSAMVKTLEDLDLRVGRKIKDITTPDDNPDLARVMAKLREIHAGYLLVIARLKRNELPPGLEGKLKEHRWERRRLEGLVKGDKDAEKMVMELQTCDSEIRGRLEMMGLVSLWGR
ncbi:hypothetical protein K440DRAFT_616649 [Wilcoxina mikolae CBS 423.85]|nr:hypothetical protein K440DRAFT_616649 [Wilcoxina mikolae CBS 423.85]